LKIYFLESLNPLSSPKTAQNRPELPLIGIFSFPNVYGNLRTPYFRKGKFLPEGFQKGGTRLCNKNREMGENGREWERMGENGRKLEDIKVFGAKKVLEYEKFGVGV
jgi:hypothetical protein